MKERCRFRPQLESLEDRCTPSSLHGSHADSLAASSETSAQKPEQLISSTTIWIPSLFGHGNGHHRNGAIL